MFVETAVLAFCASKIGCVVPSYIRDFRRAGRFLQLRGVFRPRVSFTKSFKTPDDDQ
jgi:hypothetical protein